jgi:hypothetical protein
VKATELDNSHCLMVIGASSCLISFHFFGNAKLERDSVGSSRWHDTNLSGE